jgi:hypothetical protein
MLVIVTQYNTLQPPHVLRLGSPLVVILLEGPCLNKTFVFTVYINNDV